MSRELRYGASPSKGLINISTRGQVGSGEKIMISGFVVVSDEAKDVLLRSVGPELENFDIVNHVTDPQLQLFINGNETPIATNDDWGQNASASELANFSQSAGAFPLSSDSQDAANVISLGSGIYTLRTMDANPQGSIALAEVYGENLINISTRAVAGQGEDTLIAGFVLRANEPTTVLIRGIGPSLEDFDISEFLNDPVITLLKIKGDESGEVIASNDNWIDGDKASLVEVAANISGAFPLSQDSRDAALLVQLTSGMYSVTYQVRVERRVSRSSKRIT